MEDQKKRLESNLHLLQDDKTGLAKRLETFDERESELLRKLTVMEEIKSKLTVLDLEYKLKVEILKTLEDIIEIEQELHSDSCTTNP